jgi:type II secretory pathway component GspD/PulD (secretin)
MAQNSISVGGSSHEQGNFRVTEDGKVQGVVIAKNVRASELADYIRNSLISPKGAVMADDSVNRIYIEDTPEQMKQILEYIRMNDIVPEACLIECQVIEIDITDDPDIMVAFEVWKDIAAIRSEEDFAAIYSAALSNAVSQGAGLYDTGGIHLKGVYSEVLAEFIEYLVRSGKAKSVTQHTIKGLNGKTAFVSSVVRSVNTENEKIDTTHVPGVLLAITPIVTPSRLALKVKGKVNSCTISKDGDEPRITTRTAENTIELKEGELCVLLGLRQESLYIDSESTPVLGAIPWLGRIFQERVETRKQHEIIVLLTPNRQ